tara:strand:- start:1 stop:387 length:387 start_codon:yes stop_codon:yes gene_type:complete
MSYIYLVKPIGKKLRPIDKDKRFLTGERPMPPKVNEKNLKCGKWEGDFDSLKKRYDYRVGNVETRIVLSVDGAKVREFEKLLKITCFKKYIKNFQNATGRKTQEWMLGIEIDEAEKMIKDVFDSYKNN